MAGVHGFCLILNVVMNRMPQPSSNATLRRRARAGLLLGLFLFVLAMAQFRALHHMLHADSGTVDHQCAVTLLASGHVDVAVSEVPVAFLPVLAVAPAIPSAQVFVTVDYSLLPGRAPPVVLA
jgi:hypothetical protein